MAKLQGSPKTRLEIHQLLNSIQCLLKKTVKIYILKTEDPDTSVINSLQITPEGTIYLINENGEFWELGAGLGIFIENSDESGYILENMDKILEIGKTIFYKYASYNTYDPDQFDDNTLIPKGYLIAQIQPIKDDIDGIHEALDSITGLLEDLEQTIEDLGLPAFIVDPSNTALAIRKNSGILMFIAPPMLQIGDTGLSIKSEIRMPNATKLVSSTTGAWNVVSPLEYVPNFADIIDYLAYNMPVRVGTESQRISLVPTEGRVFIQTNGVNGLYIYKNGAWRFNDIKIGTQTTNQYYTLTANDKGRLLEFHLDVPGVEHEVTIPPSVFAKDDIIDVIQMKASKIKFIAGSGVTLDVDSRYPYKRTYGRTCEVRIRFTSPTTAVITGGLE